MQPWFSSLLPLPVELIIRPGVTPGLPAPAPPRSRRFLRQISLPAGRISPEVRQMVFKVCPDSTTVISLFSCDNLLRSQSYIITDFSLIVKQKSKSVVSLRHQNFWSKLDYSIKTVNCQAKTDVGFLQHQKCQAQCRPSLFIRQIHFS
jgi:hypothetical protein